MTRFVVGTTAVRSHTVRDADCATNWANDLPVLATPVLLWLGETTAMQVIESALADGEMSVGYAHTSAEHLAATPAGWTVTVTATLTRVDGRMLEFSIEASDTRDLIFRGTHVRAVIDRDRFIRRFDRKVAEGPLAEDPLTKAGA